MNREEARAKYPQAETLVFGDNQELCGQLLAFVRSGLKTATCTALRDIENSLEEMPTVGRMDISLNWDGTAALVIETTEVAHRRFDEVQEEFALAEGENDNLEGWRQDHRVYFERNGGYDPKMDLVCERFRMIEDLS